MKINTQTGDIIFENINFSPNKQKLHAAILIPIASSMSGKLIPQLLDLKTWCLQRNILLLTISNRIIPDCRNWLSTAGGGFKLPTNLIEKVDNLIWIDSDIQFTFDKLNALVYSKEDFVSGWYLKDLQGAYSNYAMVGLWDERHFKEYGSMKFFTQQEIEYKDDKFEVDFCGFGFTKVSSRIMKQLSYPYFEMPTQAIGDYSDVLSEDVNFCRKLHKELNIKPIIYKDLKVNHLKELYI